MSAHQKYRFSSSRRQRGAVLMLLLLLVSVGALAVFVSGLNRATEQLERDRITAAALAQAKEALIGYAAKDANRPGELPCPDVDNDGQVTLSDYNGSDCKKLVGRLPWKSLGLTELRDGGGETLWYAVSDAFHANGTTPINSDTPGTLAVTGSISAIQVIAVVFAPGMTLAGQLRDSSNENKVENYLEAANSTSTTDFVAGDATAAFNDRLMPVLASNLFPLIENRIARDAKKCLDDYALISGGKYPWAAKLDGTATPDFAGDVNAGFGRFPQTPNTGTSAVPPPAPQQCADAQSVLNNPPCSHSMAPQQCQAAQAIVQACSSNDPVMSAAWTSDCVNMFVNQYWGDWKELILYQVSPGYQPGGSAICPTCLTLNGTGSYRAMIMVAGKKLTGQKRVGDAGFTDDLTNYLEDGNSDGNYDFELKWPTATFNDKTICLDGQITCK